MKDRGMFILCKTFKGGREERGKKVQHRVLENNISNELVWEKEKQVFMENPNKFSF